MNPENAAPKAPVTCLLLAASNYTDREDIGSRLRHSLGRVTDLLGIKLIGFGAEVEYGGLVSEMLLQIPRTIENADVIIADITGADPNVMYELGFAHALKKPVFPIARREEQKIPSDLQGYLYYPYEVSSFGPEKEFETTLTRWLRRTLGDRLR